MQKLTSEEFYNYLVPDNRKSDFYKKVYEKLFSLTVGAVKGNFTHKFEKTAYGEDGITIIGELNGCKIFYVFSVLSENSYYNSVPTKVAPNRVEFASGYMWTPSYNYKYTFAKLGEKYVPEFVDDIFNAVRTMPNCNGLYLHYNYALSDAMKSNPDKWVKLSDDYKYNNLYLCTEQFFPNINVGDIFEKHTKYFFHRRVYSFKEVYENKYSDFQNYTVNLAGEIENPTNYEISCNKQKYGCHRGCTHSCLADNVKKKNREIYKKFLEWSKHLK